MSEFYRKAVAVFSALLLLSIIVAAVCIPQSYVKHQFFPLAQSELPWSASAHSDGQLTGRSTAVINEADALLDYSYMLYPSDDGPYAGVALTLTLPESDVAFVDLSKYKTISFMATCNLANTLTFTISTLDPLITKPNSAISHRPAMAHFACNPLASLVSIDIHHLEVPDWWLRDFSVDLSSRSYSLQKSTHFNFGISAQSPLQKMSQVRIEGLAIQGRIWAWLVCMAIVFALLWSGFIFWLFRGYTQALRIVLGEKSKTDEQFYVQRELSLESQGDKNKSAVLAYMSSEYADPNLSVDLAVSVLGVNRIKINTVLKEASGLTFSAYLNKLRLLEAARLLAESDSANVAEIAYSVGYKNVSYFNKLFKDEYTCTPKTYKAMRNSESVET